ncbi:MAG TPA: dienelactone hydrolase family protein [Thermoanaerobaculia bacterium]|nr:dienelactone hydrolase family protein [Thermoanaerobaculia bacterium]
MTTPVSTLPLQIPIGKRPLLNAEITIPAGAKGVVLFVHSCRNGRQSPRTRFLASQLNFLQLATMLVDLLTTEEEALDELIGRLHSDVGTLTRRIVQMIDWTHSSDLVGSLPLGLCAGGIDAAAALDAAAERTAAVRAVVSQGGRPDLAAHIDAVQAPTLLIAGANDEALDDNVAALERLRCERHLEIVPGATHRFEEPGALEAVAAAATAWFRAHLR